MSSSRVLHGLQAMVERGLINRISAPLPHIAAALEGTHPSAIPKPPLAPAPLIGNPVASPAPLATSSGVFQAATKKPSVYAGFDPTGPSLHLGHLPLLLLMRRLRDELEVPLIVVLGGATAAIGDPTGKTADRSVLPVSEIQANGEGVVTSITTVLGSDFTLVDNSEFYKNMNIIQYLRDIGPYFRLSSMMNKDSVKGRLEPGASGMSLTEFTYQTLQAYDFWQLHCRHNCVIQLGGSDQWGNITAGLEFVRKLRAEDESEAGSVFGATVPLVTSSNGKKFGKTEGNAVWINADRTSTFDLYQYLMGLTDEEAVLLLPLITTLSKEEIEESLRHKSQPWSLQKRLADNVVKSLRGKDDWRQARAAIATLFGESPAWSSDNAEKSVRAAVASGAIPCVTVREKPLVGLSVLDAAVLAGLCNTKSEARRLILGGGFHVNERKIASPTDLLSASDIVEGGYVMFKAGKKHFRALHSPLS